MSVAGDGSCSSSNPANSFSKDGCKISVGDCALFKPPLDSPPAEVKLGKGILLEVASN